MLHGFCDDDDHDEKQKSVGRRIYIFFQSDELLCNVM